MVDGTVLVARDSARDIDVPIHPLKQIGFTPNASVTLRYIAGDGTTQTTAVTSGTFYDFPVTRILSTTSAAVVLTFKVGSEFTG